MKAMLVTAFVWVWSSAIFLLVVRCSRRRVRILCVMSLTLVAFSLVVATGTNPGVFFVATTLGVVTGWHVCVLLNLRRSLEPEDIPARLASKCERDLAEELQEAARFDFSKIDAYRIRTNPPTVTYVLKSKHRPIYLVLGRMGQVKLSSFDTFYSNGVRWETAPEHLGISAPRPRNSLLQIVAHPALAMLLAIHEHGRSFLAMKGLTPVEVPPAEVREFLTRLRREQLVVIQALPFWPLRLLVWAFSRRREGLFRSIEEQVQCARTKL